MKECVHCGNIKALTEFRYRKKRNSIEYYRMAECIECERQKERDRYYQNHEENKQKLRQKVRFVYYGVTENQYQEMIQKQNNTCAICNTSEPGGRGGWHVDHNHTTGKVRGLLCHCCNTGLGLFKDSQELLIKAKDYLNECK